MFVSKQTDIIKCVNYMQFNSTQFPPLVKNTILVIMGLLCLNYTHPTPLALATR